MQGIADVSRTKFHPPSALRRGGITTIKVTYYDVGPGGQLAPFETFTLRRPRRAWTRSGLIGRDHLRAEMISVWMKSSPLKSRGSPVVFASA